MRLGTAVAVAAFGLTLAACGSGLPATPTEPFWSVEAAATTVPETTEPTETAPVTESEVATTTVRITTRRRAVPPAPLPLVAPPRTVTRTVTPTTTPPPAPVPLLTTTTTGGGKTATTKTAPKSSDGDGAVSYANCDAVRAAGKAPLHKGDPGYRTGLDRDGDGIACEPKP